MSVNASQSLSLPELSHASMANGKIARVRSIPPSTLLVTGISPGETMLRAWDRENNEHSYTIRVVPSHLRHKSGTEDLSPVVKISLELLELESSEGQSLGIRWPESFSFVGSAALQGLSSITGVNHSIVFSSAKGWMGFLVSEGWARVVANPDLYVRMGEEAVFHSGGELPVAMMTESYGRVSRHIQWKEFGLTVKVRPQSADNFLISSDVHIEVSEVNGDTAVEGIPTLTRRRLDTKMDSSDGETVILSGLVREKNSRLKEGLPFLAHLPLVGVLFSSNSNSRRQSELLMAMTLSLRTKSRNKEALEKKRDRLLRKDPVGS